LIDTGATVSVLTKDTDLIIKRNSKTPVLPVSGVQISNTIGKKKYCNITRQIYCECTIGEVRTLANFIRIENLNEKGIIGADILAQYNAKINFNNKTIQWNINNVEYTTPFANKAPKKIPQDEQVQSIESTEEEESYEATSIRENK